jgi:hypothetical protein
VSERVVSGVGEEGERGREDLSTKDYQLKYTVTWTR